MMRVSCLPVTSSLYVLISVLMRALFARPVPDFGHVKSTSWWRLDVELLGMYQLFRQSRGPLKPAGMGGQWGW